MKLNLFYSKVLPLVEKLLYFRPLLIISSDAAHRQFKFNPDDSDLSIGDRVPIQFKLGDNLNSFIEKNSPVEIHMGVTHFFESTFKHLFIDLDASPSMGLATVFDYAMGLKDFVLTISPTRSIKMVFSGNRGFHLHVELSQRLLESEAKEYLVKVCSYPKPFIGKIDVGVNTSSHFIRVPYSYNLKGGKFSFYVDRLKEFNNDIALEWSERLYNGATKNG
jgi:hypothetical protein